MTSASATSPRGEFVRPQAPIASQMFAKGSTRMTSALCAAFSDSPSLLDYHLCAHRGSACDGNPL